MSEQIQQPAPQPGWGQPGYVAPDAPKPKFPKGTGRVAVAIYALIVGIGIGALGGGGEEPTTTANAPAASQKQEPAAEPVAEPAKTEEPAPEPEPTPEKAFKAPTTRSFKLEVKTLEKDCFGSAGCLVSFRVEPTYRGYVSELDPAITYEVTYEVTGDEDGPIVKTFEITGNQVDYGWTDEETASTPSSGTVLKAKVTDVSEQ